MRTRFYATIACALLTGCAYFPDFEHTPSARLPVAEVVNQIRCDMYQFLRKYENEPGRRVFTLDKRSYATVELTLSTTAFGDVKFSKIDTVRLGADGFLAIGSSSQPFPSLGLKQASQVVTKVVVNIAQNSKNLSEQCEGGRQYGYGEILSSKPHADRVLINDMRIASWLERTFSSGDRIAGNAGDPFCNNRPDTGSVKPSHKMCAIGLETATLTTKFQIVGDASAGILDFAKLVPVVVTPTLQLNADYYHQIQIIFQGNNVVSGDVVGTFGDRDRIDEGFRLRTYERDIGCDPATESKRTKEQNDRCRDLRRLRSQIESQRSDGSAEIARQLRSIRDALILNGIRP